MSERGEGRERGGGSERGGESRATIDFFLTALLRDREGTADREKEGVRGSRGVI